MDKYQPLSQESKKGIRAASAFFFFCAVFFLFFPAHTISTSGFSAITFDEWVFTVFGVISAIGATSVLFIKKELTPEAKAEQELKDKEFDLWSKWYIRYPTSILMLGVAYISYTAYIKGIRLPGLALLLLNPVSGVIAVVIAIFNAWELSLLVLIGVILFYMFQGIAALPTSVAIIIGAIIIAYAVNKYKA